jgi:hypothetical protein
MLNKDRIVNGFFDKINESEFELSKMAVDAIQGLE